jgi:Polyketide cyclase / dehydrase and lipid transport
MMLHLLRTELAMLIPVGIGLTIGIATVAVTIATRPAAFRIVRSQVLSAPVEALFGYVNDFHLWDQWSPFAKLDPNLKVGFEGAAQGVGAVYHWSGNSKAGAGRMTITDSRALQRIAIDLSFSKPMPAENKAEFTFEPVSEGTRVTWSMTGHNNFVGKAFALVMDMDKMVGRSFEQGLSNLGVLASAQRSLAG